MNLGVLTVLFADKSLEDTLKFLKAQGVTHAEIGSGGYPGKAHLDPLTIIDNPDKAVEYLALFKKHDIKISALSTHNNPVHPNKETAKKAHEEFVNTCKAAKMLGIDTVVTFSGCPGDSENSKNPNWVTCSWPPDYVEVLDYQWNKVLIPYWREAVKIAKSYGVTKIALEMHPGFCVYNPGTLLRLREAVGDTIGANLDPSHLYWQGIRPSEAVKALKGAIYHFHAKDTKLAPSNVAINGVLDSTHYSDIANRAWVFCTVGYGHDYCEWKETIMALRVAGYDGTISIEHEDSLMSKEEGLKKAITFLKDIIIFEKPSEMWWA